VALIKAKIEAISTSILEQKRANELAVAELKKKLKNNFDRKAEEYANEIENMRKRKEQDVELEECRIEQHQNTQ
jgi:molecular chaperone GrpE (heat shock protein)